jgi:hypothetical protein
VGYPSVALAFPNTLLYRALLYRALLDSIAEPLAWAARRRYLLHQPGDVDASIIFEGAYRAELMPGYHVVLLQHLYVAGLATNGVDL